MRSLSLSIVLIVVGLVLLATGCNSYNNFIDQEEDVANAWAEVQSNYQRRADLIPNLVATVKGAADFEKSTLTQVTEARAKATSVNISAEDLSPAKMQQYQDAQSALSQSLGRLLMVSERYPELQANSNFQELQAQLEGTENRIKVARDRYNDAVTKYNKQVRRFPGSLFAGMFGFDRKEQFEAEEAAQSAPKVEF